MSLYLQGPDKGPIQAHLQITGSKSESNRLLLLQALYHNIHIGNLSNADDVEVMQKGLRTSSGIVDIHHAGTAMRFLTAFFASQPGKEVTLTGSERMRQRPIGVLVEALRSLGAEIQYMEKEGYPPLGIRGKSLQIDKVTLPANISSQYISALLLIAPKLQNGLELQLKGQITSRPYIEMTLSLLGEIEVETSFNGNEIRVLPKTAVQDANLVVESDWSSASYFYSIAALSEPGTEIRLSSYKENSLQGDSVLRELFLPLGVVSSFENHDLIIRKQMAPETASFNADLLQAPDLAQTIAVCCFGLGIGCDLQGLHTLKIKETDRLLALETELAKLGAEISVSNDSLHLDPGSQVKAEISIATYNDHRMAMAFAPLALRAPIWIEDPGVVSKSYPDFWVDLRKLGFSTLER